MLGIPGIFGDAESGRLRGAAHGEFIHIGLSQDNCPGVFQFSHRLCGIGGNKMFQNLRTASGAQSFGTQIVFDCYWDSRQGTGERSLPDLSLHLFRPRKSPFPVYGNKTVYLGFFGVNGVQRRPDRLLGSHFPGFYFLSQLQGCQ